MADVAELNPRHDPDGRTARAAARLVHEMAAIG
jgi:arginase family enzyme